MTKFDEHIEQAARNFLFLEQINNSIDDCVDWQVTVCFYTSLHIVNAHLTTGELNYRSHKDVDNVINFAAVASPFKLPQAEYLSYKKLQSLSRRSRYLVNGDNASKDDGRTYFTHSIHLKRAIGHLDKLIKFFTSKYGFDLPKIKLKCEDLKNDDYLTFIKKV